MKKVSILGGFLILASLVFAQKPGTGGVIGGGNGNGPGTGGQSGNSGQPGTATNPEAEYYVDQLYVNQQLKVGLNSVYIGNTQPTGGEVLYSTSNPLVINGYALGQANQGNIQNTIINPQESNVGIGLTLPETKLDIKLTKYKIEEGGVRITASPTVGSDPVTDNQIVFEIRRQTPGLIKSTPLFVVQDDGQVGIGTAFPDPGTKLQVQNGILKLTGMNAAGGPMIVFGGNPTDAPNGQWGIEYNTAGTQSGLNFWKPVGSGNYGNYYMFLADNGKVSIGLDPNDPNTYNGDYKLYVADGIMTEKLKVALRTSNEWADYVFASDYELMPLTDVQTYINENGHLPNVPSADEVKDSGIDVAQMDAKLLEKIEELTLYILEQEKRIQQLEAQQTK